MRIFPTGLVAALITAASLQAAAQPIRPSAPGDIAYCDQLFAIHERYLLPRGFDGDERRDPRADLAVDLCHRNRTAEGIAILEGKLTRARFRLPDRG